MEKEGGIIGLTAGTAKVFDAVSRMECIRNLYLCGGTALSLQLGHRLSEDLDFELLGFRRERPQMDVSAIIGEVRSLFGDVRVERRSESYLEIFLPGGVKLSFFRPENNVPVLTEGYRYNNLKTPVLQEMLGMKLFAVTVRYTYRDYYDIYCLLKKGLDFAEGIDYACRFSKHAVHSKTILSSLLMPSMFVRPADFGERMRPMYDVSHDDIAEYMREVIGRYPGSKRNVAVGGEAVRGTGMTVMDRFFSPMEKVELVGGEMTEVFCRGLDMLSKGIVPAGRFAPQDFYGNLYSPESSVLLSIRLAGNHDWLPVFFSGRQLSDMNLTAVRGAVRSSVIVRGEGVSPVRDVVFNIVETDYPDRYPDGYAVVRNIFHHCENGVAASSASIVCVSYDAYRERAEMVLWDLKASGVVSSVLNGRVLNCSMIF